MACKLHIDISVYVYTVLLPSAILEYAVSSFSFFFSLLLPLFTSPSLSLPNSSFPSHALHTNINGHTHTHTDTHTYIYLYIYIHTHWHSPSMQQKFFLSHTQFIFFSEPPTIFVVCLNFFLKKSFFFY